MMTRMLAFSISLLVTATTFAVPSVPLAPAVSPLRQNTTYQAPELSSQGPIDSERIYRATVSLAIHRNDGRSGTCMGTLVAQDLVLTAGHCLKPAADIDVRLHTANNRRFLVREAKHWTFHPSERPKGQKRLDLGDDAYLFEDIGLILIEPAPVFNEPLPILENYIAWQNSHAPTMALKNGALVELEGHGDSPTYLISRDLQFLWSKTPFPLTLSIMDIHSRSGDERSKIFSGSLKSGSVCAGDSGAAVLAVHESTIGIIGVFFTNGNATSSPRAGIECGSSAYYTNVSLGLPYIKKMERTLYELRAEHAMLRRR